MSVLSSAPTSEDKYLVCKGATPKSFDVIDKNSYVFACENGSAVCGTVQNSIYKEFELQDSSMMKRFWKGFLPGLVRCNIITKDTSCCKD